MNNNNIKPMTKIVNINARFPVKSIVPPIYGTLKNVEMSTSNILKCLIRHAIIEEVLPDGTTIPIDYKNYYTDNSKGHEAVKEKVVENIAPVETPINQEDTIEEVEDDEIDEETDDTEEEISPVEFSNNQNNNHQNYNRNKKRRKRH